MSMMGGRILCFAGLLLACSPAGAMPREIEVENGVRIHVDVTGPAKSNKPALVLIPGWRFPGQVWQGQIAAFSGARTVITIDPRSQGASTMTGEGTTPERRAIDLATVLAALGADDFVLVGWSQGVQDVAAYLRRYGTGKVAGIVLIDSTVSKGAAAIPNAPDAVARQLRLLPIYLEDPRAYTEGMIDAIITRPLTPQDRVRYVDMTLATPPAIGASMLVADMFGVDRSEAVGMIDRPTLIIASQTSAELSEQMAMASAIPGSEFRMVENAGHAVFIDQPDAFNAILEDFLKKLGTHR